MVVHIALPWYFIVIGLHTFIQPYLFISSEVNVLCSRERGQLCFEGEHEGLNPATVCVGDAKNGLVCHVIIDYFLLCMFTLFTFNCFSVLIFLKNSGALTEAICKTFSACSPFKYYCRLNLQDSKLFTIL